MILQLLSGQMGILGFIILSLSLVFAVSFHEFAHAWAAEKLGDNTPRLFGRLTLNPLAHLDPLGTLMILVSGFGWGKPTPINPFNMENPMRDSALVSLAGPASNILLALVFSLPLKLGLFWAPLLIPAIILNVSLAVFNLIPIYPLDGFKIVGGVLPPQFSLLWQRTAQYGFILILVLVFLPLGNFSLISFFVRPISQTILRLVLGNYFSLF